MSTYRELTYMIQDELKLVSDDSNYTVEHIIFLLSKYKTFLIKQRYSDIRKRIPESNYQTICLDLIEVPAISGEPCEGGSYLRSSIRIPHMLNIGNTRVYPIDYYQGEISFITRDRMRYVGYNRFLPNIIYCSIGPDRYLYFKSFNPQYLYLEKVRLTGIFEDSNNISSLLCNKEDADSCDILDQIFPIEEGLVPPLIELVVKELGNAMARPEDSKNNSRDDLTNE